MRRFLLLLMMAAATAGEARAQRADSIPKSNAYLDATAGELVKLARERRQIADLSVEAYKALSKERISVGLRGLRRDRLLYRREVAGRLSWTRDGEASVEVLGAREAVPVAMKNVQLPSDLGSYMPHLAFDPADNRMLLDWGDEKFVRHPLAPDAERFYKYRTGGTTSIQLPDGKTVRLIELEIIPRVTDPHNISGSFWLDADTHAVVQAAFRLARDINIIRDIDNDDDGDGGDDDDVPGWLRPLVASVDYVTIQYGLYELKWWMPRSVLFEGSVRAGFLRMPMQYERTYSSYEITGSETPMTTSMAEIIARDTLNRIDEDKCNAKMNVNVRIGDKDRDTTTAANAATRSIKCGRWTVTVSTDTSALLNSSELPENVFAGGEQLVTEGELRELGKQIEKISTGPAMLPSPIPDASLLAASRMRYNRVEALSGALHGELDYGAMKLSAEGRIGIGDLEPNFELAAQRTGANTVTTLAGYRRLNAFDPNARPFSFGSSLSALLFGVDDADYYRSLGAEVRLEPSGAGARWYALRLFAEHEKAADKETDFSLRHALNNDYRFRPNRQAESIDAYGSEAVLRFNRGLDPDGFRYGAELYGHGAFGTTEFGRGAVTMRMGFPLFSGFSAALEGATGITSTDAPVQHLWYLGGTNTLRGYRAGVLSGEAFWRGRAEIGYGLPAVRIIGFSDAAWAGARDEYEHGRPLISAGAGVSLLDGIVRFDVARGFKAPKGWAATLYFDAAL